MREDRSDEDRPPLPSDPDPGPDSDSESGTDERRGPVSTLTIVTVLFFLGIGVILLGVWHYGEMIVTAGRGASILMLGIAFIIVLNLIAIVLMLVLLRTIKGRDE